MNRSIYFPDNSKTKQIMQRVDLLQKSYGCSFSEIVLASLKEFVKVKKPSRKNPTFRTPKLAGIRDNKSNA